MKKFIRSRKGFTLVEMLIVIAIIVILGGVTIVGIRAMIENSKKNAAAVELHAGCWYIEDPNGIETMMGGTVKKIKVVDRNTPGAQYYSDMDDMFEQVRRIQGTVSNVEPAHEHVNTGDDGFDDEWWAKNDADWQKKIDDLIKAGCPQDQIKVVRNKDGHIVGVSTDWKPDSNSGNSSNNDANTGSNGSGNTGSNTGNNDSNTGSNTGNNQGNTGNNTGNGDANTGSNGSGNTGDSGNTGNTGNNTGTQSSGAITVPNKVTSGTGVKDFTNNSDGTTTATLILNTYNTGEVKFRTNPDGTHSIYCVGKDGHTVVGNVIGYTQDNQWCNENTWIKLTPGDWAKLSSSYGFN